MASAVAPKQLKCCEDVVRAKQCSGDYLDDVRPGHPRLLIRIPGSAVTNLGSSELSVQGLRLHASIRTKRR